jgi:MarR family transcriptional regulator, 2-MHQ and catechol-resistance regulon repressor
MRDTDLLRLDESLNQLATLYQFRSTDEPTYGTLTVSQSYCLRMLYFHGPQTMSELAAGLQVQLSTMTGVIDQLEAKHLVRRAAHPEDRRSLRVDLTPKGKKLYHAAHDVFLSYLKRLFHGRSAADREKILSFLDDLMQAIHEWRQVSHEGRRNGKENS